MTAAAPWACRCDPVAATACRHGTVSASLVAFPDVVSYPTTTSSIYKQLRSLMLSSLCHCFATVPDAFRASSHYFASGRNQSVRCPYPVGGADGPCWKTCLAPQ